MQHECEETLPPHPHARNARGRNNRFSADVIRDFRQASTVELRLLLGKTKTLRNRRCFHEAVMQGHAAETNRKIQEFGPFILADARLFRREHRDEENAFVQGMDMFEMKGECKRNTGGSGREEGRGAREADRGPCQQLGNEFLLTLTQS